MSDLVAAPAETPDVVKDSEHVIEPVSRAPILITVHEVASSTAAAATRRDSFLEQAATAREMRRL